MEDHSISCHKAEVNYQKYLKKIDINVKMTRELLTNNSQVDYLQKPSADTYQHPRYPSFNLTYPRISTERQLQYYRSLDKHIQIPSELLRTFIQQDKNKLISRKRNGAIIIDEGVPQYLYTKDQKIMCLRLQARDSSLKILKQSVFCSLNRPILELVNHNDHILVRSHYSCYIHSMMGSLLYTISSDDEIICSAFNIFNREQVITSHEKQIRINNFQKNTHNSVKIDSVATSIDIKSNNVLIIQQNNTISSIDLRTNHQDAMLKSTDTLYDVKWMRSEFTCSPYYVVSTNLNLQTYDYRNPRQPCLRVKHLSEEVPPNILQVFQGNTRPSTIRGKMLSKIKKLNNMVVVAYNSSAQTNCLFWEHIEPKINRVTVLDSMRKVDSRRAKFSEKFPVLLYDSGKAFDHCFPVGLTPYVMDDDLLAFFQLDNLGGISLQAFEFGEHYQPAEIRNREFLTDFSQRDMVNYERVMRLQQEKYFKKNDAYHPKMEMDEDDVEFRKPSRGKIEFDKTGVADLRDFTDRLFQLAQSNEEIDQQSSECTESEHDTSIFEEPQQSDDEIGRTSTLQYLRKAADDLKW